MCRYLTNDFSLEQKSEAWLIELWIVGSESVHIYIYIYINYQTNQLSICLFWYRQLHLIMWVIFSFDFFYLLIFILFLLLFLSQFSHFISNKFATNIFLDEISFRSILSTVAYTMNSFSFWNCAFSFDLSSKFKIATKVIAALDIANSHSFNHHFNILLFG